MIRRLTIFGVGLIGGSLALALRRAGTCEEVVGCSRSEDHLRQAVELGVIDRYSLDPAEAVAGADMVVLAVPLGAMGGVCAAIRDHLAPDAALTDVGSAKGSVVDAVREGFGELPHGFVPGHPIAGTERSGVAAAFPTLFQGRRVILTPLDTTDIGALAKVRTMWEETGAVVESMSVAHHDEILAATSHLPHLLAFGLVDSLARMGERDEIFRYAAGGFRDFTRIASSDPVMWRDICLSNREAILSVMAHYQEDLTMITEAVSRGDGERLLEIFQRAKAARDRFCE
ncbi:MULTISPECIES: prephenate dehydrogenase [Ectothiorhodospira]|uniref:prephenate dehydrogenase n=1 Tax=Ectothiorhodospira TaxID=1051 RepID=UPI00024A828D|nr:prephenate dehydrogenase/arogenate dehydrogenase family protein [Ectothiorhodospira sp. PHS-1]EHQ52668.1 prephenate dehydrogenase [Ectothiorhodospira sp. PHS-1]MCG5512554.1 prephenate dehydrogenase/arogenate dehydrogenase family protein [Ectothiorhodospira shaposhnikovii]